MTTLPVLATQQLDTLFAARLLCDICESSPWTQRACYHEALLCADCAESEPSPDDNE